MSMAGPALRLDPDAFATTLDAFGELGLVTAEETSEILAMLAPDFPYAAAVSAAESVHVHVKVPDVDALPHARIEALGSTPTSCTAGYVKYPFAGGINLIFSSIPISEDDMLLDAVPPRCSVLDHKGVDLRRELPEVRAAFDEVPAIAAARNWRHVRQGGDGTPVYCCHTEVQEKHWIYPDLDPGGPGQRRPIEFAFGDLVLHDAKMGCDLRPIDPAHPQAAEAQAALSACAAGHADEPAGGSYYEPADLGKFAEVGRAATQHMQRFWAYYNGVFAADGALTLREKALIGLAVAHVHQCPYCIDSFTGSCVDHGATVEQMHEALHVSAALAAGVHLVHGVQMRNALARRGAS